MHPRVLIIEDDHDVAENLAHCLRNAGFTAEHAGTGLEGLRRAQDGNPDAIILDLGLPDLAGEHVARHLHRTCRAPVLVLTATDSVHRKLTALKNGAADLLTKPFDPDELIVRLRVQLNCTAAPGVLEVGGLRLVVNAREGEFQGRQVTFSPIEFGILRVLARQPGRVCSRSELIAGAWPHGAHVKPTAVEVHLVPLRRKLLELEWPGRIRTVRGVGYALKVPRVDG